MGLALCARPRFFLRRFAVNARGQRLRVLAAHQYACAQGSRFALAYALGYRVRQVRSTGREYVVVIRRRVVVHGYVQGVFFRDTVRRLAQQRGVNGWVANRPDGGVEAFFEGEAGGRRAARGFLPPKVRARRVDSVDVTDEEPQGESGFQITPTRSSPAASS
jgi:acylphosphatase